MQQSAPDPAAHHDALHPTAFNPNDPDYQNNVSSINAALSINIIIGGSCIAGFLLLRLCFAQYQLRAVLPYVTVQPPPLPIHGLGRVFGWFRVVVGTSDVWLLHSAGLDALVQQKCLALGLQLFLPIAIVGCCLLLPLQLWEAHAEDDPSLFSRFTMAKIDPSSKLMWAHWLCALSYLAWTLLLLDYHYQSYVALRQLWLSKDQPVNYWRQLHLAEADGVGVHGKSRLAEVIESARLDSIMRLMEDEAKQQQSELSWWRRKMLSLTSWTGAGTIDDVVRLAHKQTVSDGNNAVIKRMQRDARFAKLRASAPGGALSPERSGGPLLAGSQPSHVSEVRSARPLGEAQEAPHPRGTPGGSANIRQPPAAGSECKQQPPEDSAQVRSSSSTAAVGGGASTAPAAGIASAGAAAGIASGEAAVGGASAEAVAGAGSAAAGQAAALRQQAGPRPAGLFEGHSDVSSTAFKSLDSMRTASDMEKGLAASCGPTPPNDPPRVASMTDEVPFMAAPRWWSTVDVITTESGKLRRLGEDEKATLQGNHMLLAKPSVRYRKTINTSDFSGRPVAVNAQQYAVLVTNVSQPVYPEYSGKARGAGPCGEPRVKYSSAVDEGRVLGARYRELCAAINDPEVSRTVSVLAGSAGTSALRAAEAVAGLRSMSAGSGPARAAAAAAARGDPPPRASAGAASGAELWGRVRAAHEAGRLRKLLRDESYSVVSAVFSTLFPDDFDRVVPVFNFREVDDIMRQWDVRLGQLEAAEHRARATGVRRRVKPRGAAQDVDELEHLQGEVTRLEAAVLEARERALVFHSTQSYFVLFRTQKAAAIAASSNIHPLKQQLFQVHPAPGPEEVNWQALWYSHRQRMFRGFLVTPLICLVIMLPVSMLGAALTALNDTVCNSAKGNPLRWAEYCDSNSGVFKALKGVLTGFLPAIMVQLWQGLLMPRLVFWAAQSEGRHFSLSALDRRMGTIYFLWTFFNFFIGGVIGNTALTRLPQMLNQPFDTPQLLGYALPAKFFFVFLLLRLFLTLPLRWLMPHPGVWQAWIRAALSPVVKTFRDSGGVPERTRYMRFAIRSPRYGVELGGNSCLYLLVSFAFAAICPLVTLLGMALFAGEWLFWRYQFVYGYQRKYESGGLWFPFVADRVLMSAAVMVAFTGCVMIVKSAFAQATMLWIIGLVALWSYYRRTQVYYNGMNEMPLLVAQMAPRARVPSSTYVAPPLQQAGFGWHPEHLAVWHEWGMPQYSL